MASRELIGNRQRQKGRRPPRERYDECCCKVSGANRAEDGAVAPGRGLPRPEPGAGAFLRSTALSSRLRVLAIVSVLALGCRGVRGPADDGGGLEEPADTRGNLRMITMSEAVRRCRSQLTATITTVVSG
jgi:hypothetical protein